MPPAARIFISHSAKEQDAARHLEEIFRALDAKGFDVFLDKERLIEGNEWRNEIYDAALRAHGAVLLLSESAAKKSDWVIAEAGVLAARRFANRTPAGTNGFPLLVIAVPPIEPTELSTPRFEPFQFGNVQAIRSDVPDLIDRVERFFEPLQFAATPFDELTRRLAQLLPKDQQTLETAATKLGVRVDVANPQETSQTVATALFGAAVPNVYAAMKELVGAMGANERDTIVKILAPFWVDARSVAALAHIALGDPPHKALVLNAKRSLVAKLYAWRAAVEFPPTWLVLTPTAVGGENAAAAEDVDVCAAYRQAADEDADADDDEIPQLIARRARLHPVIIVLPPGVTVAAAQEVSRRYRHCTVILLTGKSVPPSTGELVTLEPLLPVDRELDLKANWDAFCALTGASSK